MKTICKNKKWKFNNTDTAKVLIDICFKEELIPTWLQSQFSSLRSLLESGTPTVRNKLGGHGQGQDVVNVTNAMASYALSLAAANIILLIEHEKEL